MLTSFQLQRRRSHLVSWDRKESVLTIQVCTSNLGYNVTPFWERGLWDWFLRNPGVIVVFIIIPCMVSLQEPGWRGTGSSSGLPAGAMEHGWCLQGRIPAPALWPLPAQPRVIHSSSFLRARNLINKSPEMGEE